MGAAASLKKIVVTGPESSGKTMLSKGLAKHLNAKLIPEYARQYVENLSRPYTFEDLENIARHQILEESQCDGKSEGKILIMDTWLIMTKVWFEVVYDRSPVWLSDSITSAKIDLFLVCSPDLPWIPDPVRENGGEMRKVLFDRYCHELENYGFPYEVIEGLGETRMKNALSFLLQHHII